MPLISRLSTGRIYHDSFDDTVLNPIWQVSPTDPTRYDINNEKAGHLRMKHGDVPLYMLMDMPNLPDFVFEIENDYTPTVVGDSGGIIVYRDIEARIELLEYYDSALNASNTWGQMRMVRHNDVYTGYGSNDGGKTWSIIGTGTAEAMSKIGLVVNYKDITGSVPFDVGSVKVFKDSKFLVSNLTPGHIVELLDNAGVVKQTVQCQPETDFVRLDLTTLPIPFTGKLRVKEGALVKETTPTMEIWGGDVFWYGVLVEIHMDSTVLNPDEEKKLGHLINGLIEKQFIVKNPGTEPIPDVKVAAAKYFDYNGYDWVLLAEDAGGNPGTYGDEILLGLMQPGESRKLWIQIKKQFSPDLHLMGSFKFLLQVTN
jgi:hypothetical protein